MKNILLDTNIIIDLLAERKPYARHAGKLFSFADNNEVKLFTSALSIANVSYILLKQKNANEVKRILSKLRLLIRILRLDEKIIDLALNDYKFNDFEDGLQYFSALENKMDIIVTRNLKDFKNSILPVMNAQQINEII